MQKRHLLVVEDDEDILELVAYNLAKAGYRVTKAATGREALARVAEEPPDLVVLDLMLPETDGTEVCRRLKGDANTSAIPVVMLTAKGEESDIVAGLELGADDYITKPFSPQVLLARIRAVLRRKEKGDADADAVIRVHNLVIHPGRREVSVDGQPVDLTYTEFSVLHVLARRPGWVFTRYQIVDAVRGGDYDVTDRSVDVQIAGLRKKLGDAGDHIQTVRGVGYRIRE
ncbi:MAG TPA: response regulator [Candidatus Hydrogenedentes bacterium]|nr:response regulator [Candidatus Hydrogenedentota bacterium]HOH50749.1 response regulator [Candidatus Hydrogenedentota bacterium]HQL93694.1 response regulator [Candidatus Hydrogenedentota bacterium]HRZ83562.1 response regulator [Candidatus Hydrogenedentota bacterium]